MALFMISVEPGASAYLLIALTVATFAAIWFALPLHRQSAI
jgi:hypothetical protein